MRKARIAEKDKIIDIISSTFDTNPGVNWLIKKRGAIKERCTGWPATRFSNHI